MVVTEKLSGKSYDPECTTEWTRSISDTIKDKLQGQSEDKVMQWCTGFVIFRTDGSISACLDLRSV